MSALFIFMIILMLTVLSPMIYVFLPKGKEIDKLDEDLVFHDYE